MQNWTYILSELTVVVVTVVGFGITLMLKVTVPVLIKRVVLSLEDTKLSSVTWTRRL